MDDNALFLAVAAKILSNGSVGHIQDWLAGETKISLTVYEGRIIVNID